MKHSIRTRFTSGMIFLFVIISVLSVFSGYYLNTLSRKTDAIHKENFLSVVYAREMSEAIMNINLEINSCYLSDRIPDSGKIAGEIKLINLSLISEKNNLTEPGEDKLVSGIEKEYFEYRDSLQKSIKKPLSAPEMLQLQNKSGDLYQQLAILSQMNGKALETKTDDAKLSARNALTKMTILASLCFLVGMSFTYSFASYFNRRFYQLFNGLKELVSSNFDKQLLIDGDDEFYEISLVVNEMSGKLKKNKQKKSVTLEEETTKGVSTDNIEDLRNMISRLKTLDKQASDLLSEFEKNRSRWI